MPRGVYDRPSPRPLVDRFWAKIALHGEDECWLWTGAITSAGYGEIAFDGAPLLAHRVAWKIHHGSIPKGMCVCHHCDNRICCNPTHLFLGTRIDNNADMMAKGRNGWWPRPGEENPMSKLTAAQVIEIRTKYARGDVSQRGLAKQYGVAQTSIGQIVNYHTWKHLG